MPWKDAVGDFRWSVLFVFYPREDGSWFAASVNDAVDKWAVLLPFPQAWAGLADERLAEVCGVPDAVFCHAARFCCVARSRDGILAIIKATLETNP